MARKPDASEGMRNPSDGASPPAARRLTLVQLAAALNRDRNTVKGWLDKGCPAVVRANRATGQTWVLDLADVVKWLEQRASETAAGVAAGVDDEDLISREEADRRTAVIRSKKEAISLDDLQRSVIRVDVALDLVAAEYASVRQAFENIPSTMAGRLATESDPARIQATLDDAVRSALASLKGEVRS